VGRPHAPSDPCLVSLSAGSFFVTIQTMQHKNLVSITSLDRKDIESYVDLANQLSKKSLHKIDQKQFVVAILFFEESTRTQIGFTIATYRLGGHVVIMNETKHHPRMGTAESLEDTIRSIQSYCDVICLRHPNKDIYARLKPILKKPIINCGNGDDEHPTQTLIDLLTINNEFNRLDNLYVAVIGNPRYSRSAHSLLHALSRFANIQVRTISPTELYLPEEYKKIYLSSGNILEEDTEMNIRDMDVLYVTGFPANLPVKMFSQETQSKYWITPELIPELKKDAIILCPLPRIDEINIRVDDEPQAKYFKQSKNGLYMRMAILNKLLS